uniref:Fatty acid hydroxylase domain-containing protein n=1 Tax=Hemiselmis andersenii TaxID=464988 RepID=A0A6U2C440_HEMAN|mmetsp:Transcript_19158/g.44165  ORF Transcript_19158/g.44165 Transcript_19158/m.44165 type:complete len:266 (-) Transcript_19158:23-820(-)
MPHTTAAPSTAPAVQGGWPDPTGLCCGIFAVICGQCLVIAYHFWHVHNANAKRIQKPKGKEPPPDTRKTFWQDCLVHLSQPEGFILLGGYLVGTWMFNLLPATYYTWDGGVNLLHVFMQLACQDCIQTVMHMGEHKISPKLYQQSHKPHHRFLDPKVFDAFNGSVADTVCMILIPLYVTANVVHCNVWSYMAFGATYSSWLTLIHSEITHPWDPLFRRLGLGTAGDHHVHHRCFVYNYGHLFMWWDMLAGTYRSPMDVDSFNKDI